MTLETNAAADEDESLHHDEAYAYGLNSIRLEPNTTLYYTAVLHCTTLYYAIQTADPDSQNCCIARHLLLTMG